MSFNLEKSWSLSKSNILNECLRKYYYIYYVSNNICGDSEKVLVGEIKRLKKLSNRYFCSGHLIHDVTKDIVSILSKDKIAEIDISEITKGTVNKFRTVCREDLNSLNSNQQCKINLMEYFYGEEISGSQGKSVLETINKSLENILETKTIKDVKNKEVSIIENGDGSFNSFILHETKTFAILDLLYKDTSSNKYVVVDWKTGKENSDDRNQMLLYALYVISKHQVEIGDIICRCEYLREGSCKEYIFNNRDIEAFNLKVHSQIQKISSYLKSIDLNIPKGINTFVTTNQLNVCNMCNFKKICDGYDLNMRKNEDTLDIVY